MVGFGSQGIVHQLLATCYYGKGERWSKDKGECGGSNLVIPLVIVFILGWMGSQSAECLANDSQPIVLVSGTRNQAPLTDCNN